MKWRNVRIFEFDRQGENLYSFFNESNGRSMAMKLGFCAGLTANDTYKVGMNAFAFLKDCGYDYVELPLSRVSMMPDAAFALLRAAL